MSDCGATRPPRTWHHVFAPSNKPGIASRPKHCAQFSLPVLAGVVQVRLGMGFVQGEMAAGSETYARLQVRPSALPRDGHRHATQNGRWYPDGVPVVYLSMHNTKQFASNSSYKALRECLCSLPSPVDALRR